uniref:Uncharacterized protein n=1 Tax=Oryza rufipogon TaxID=4529 RepID=A0A0E0NP26_ORYRU
MPSVNYAKVLEKQAIFQEKLLSAKSQETEDCLKQGNSIEALSIQKCIFESIPKHITHILEIAWVARRRIRWLLVVNHQAHACKGILADDEQKKNSKQSPSPVDSTLTSAASYMEHDDRCSNSLSGCQRENQLKPSALHN